MASGTIGNAFLLKLISMNIGMTASTLFAKSFEFLCGRIHTFIKMTGSTLSSAMSSFEFVTCSFMVKCNFLPTLYLVTSLTGFLTVIFLSKNP
jgi:hypothetical protein